MHRAILTGPDSPTALKEILDGPYDEARFKHTTRVGESGYHLEENVWVAWYNVDGDCLVEEFPTEAAAREFAGA